MLAQLLTDLPREAFVKFVRRFLWCIVHKIDSILESKMTYVTAVTVACDSQVVTSFCRASFFSRNHEAPFMRNQPFFLNPPTTPPTLSREVPLNSPTSSRSRAP